MQVSVYELALTAIPLIGPVHARILLEQFGSAQAIFQASLQNLENIEGIGPLRARGIHTFQDFRTLEEEIHYLNKNNIKGLFYTHPAFPQRLKNCYDPPVLLYYKGEAHLNASRVVSVIGTRHFTTYGKLATEKLIAELQLPDLLVISGLAYGIDAIAHRSALRHNLSTVGVLAHGMQTIYPAEHRSLVAGMMETGGIITEFRAGTKPDRHNFPSRNRIVAGMADAVVVMETGEKGGSLITAEIANSYNREVFAYPGRSTDDKSAGCNNLIKQNKAQLIQSAADLLQAMNWDAKPRPTPAAPTLPFPNLSAGELSVYEFLGKCEKAHTDEIGAGCQISQSTLAGLLLGLELAGLVISLPGKRYRLMPH